MSHIIIVYTEKPVSIGILSIFYIFFLSNEGGDLDVLTSQLKYRKHVRCQPFSEPF